jgi:hypothetical protein
MKITAKMILDLLLNRHSDDICIPECYAAGYIDLWVMERWKERQYIGYEIKVDRQDFLNDNKWQNYLPYCTCFYFVAPKGVIKENELPPETGYLEVSKNCKMLYTKKKAIIQEKEIPESVFRYIILNRAKICKNYAEIHTQSGLEYWKEWLKEKDEKKLVGHAASEKIRRMVNYQVESVSSENEMLKSKNKRLEKVKLFCETIGFDTEKYYWSTDRLRKDLEMLLGQQFNGIPTRLSKKIDNALKKLNEVKDLVLKYEQNGKDKITNLFTDDQNRKT